MQVQVYKRKKGELPGAVWPGFKRVRGRVGRSSCRWCCKELCSNKVVRTVWPGCERVKGRVERSSCRWCCKELCSNKVVGTVWPVRERVSHELKPVPSSLVPRSMMTHSVHQGKAYTFAQLAPLAARLPARPLAA